MVYYSSIFQNVQAHSDPKIVLHLHHIDVEQHQQQINKFKEFKVLHMDAVVALQFAAVHLLKPLDYSR